MSSSLTSKQYLVRDSRTQAHEKRRNRHRDRNRGRNRLLQTKNFDSDSDPDSDADICCLLSLFSKQYLVRESRTQAHEKARGLKPVRT